MVRGTRLAKGGGLKVKGCVLRGATSSPQGGPSRFRRTPNPDRTAPVTGVISHHKIVWTSKNEIGANPKL